VRQFDAIDDSQAGRPWLPCPKTGAWCSDNVQGNQRWAGSIVNANVRHLFSNAGGFILAPTSVLQCAYPADANSQGITCPRGQWARPGCKEGCSTDCEPGKSYWEHYRKGIAECSYPPQRLQEGLQEQIDNGARSYNEVIIAVHDVEAHLPGSIEALFYVSGATPTEQAAAQTAHAAFLQAYRLSPASTPLLVLTLAGDDPFVLEADWLSCDGEAWCGGRTSG